MRSLLAAFLVLSTGCPDPEEGEGEDTSGATEVTSTGMSGSAASTSSTTTTETSTTEPATSSESGEPGSTTMVADDSSSGGATEVECEWFDEPSGERSWGRCSPRMAWQNAEDHCVTEGGHLVSIDGAQAGIFAVNVLTGFDEAWIGLNDLAAADMYEWTDGTPYEYMNWDSDTKQPDNPDHRCVALGISRRWFDYDCDEQRIFVCARPL
jgi:hypothetical protein